MTIDDDLDPNPKPRKYRILDGDGVVLQEDEALSGKSVLDVASTNYRAPWTVERLDGEHWVFYASHDAGRVE
jgi:hypothetical protein